LAEIACRSTNHHIRDFRRDFVDRLIRGSHEIDDLRNRGKQEVLSESESRVDDPSSTSQ